MKNITIRRGKPEDAKDFSHLVIFTGRRYLLHIFGPGVRNIMKNLFRHRENFFSFEHTQFIEVNGEVAGMALGYDYIQKQKQTIRGSLLVLRYLKWGIFVRMVDLLKALNVMGNIAKREYYLSNIAIYPKFRGTGLGAKLLETVEQRAKERGNKRIALEVSTDNGKAIRLYERFGHNIDRRISVFSGRRKSIEVFKMSKDLS